MSRRRTLLGIVVILVLVAGAGVTVWILTRPPSADDAARRYMTALGEGDFATISGMRQSNPDDAAESALSDAFAGATYGSEPKVEQVTSSGDRADVRASIELGGDRYPVHFTLDLRDGHWMLATDHLASLDVTTTIGDSVWVGDALVPAGPVALLPAVYPVTPAPRAVLEGGTQVAVSNDDPVSIAVEATVAEDATTLAQAQLDAYLDGCTAPAATPPAGCGIRVPWAADLATLDGLKYRIEQRPALALDAAAGTFAATGGTLVATAKGTTHAGAPGESTYRDDEWALYGTASFRGDEMVLAVR